ncbi:MAG TPA: 16S rRNA (cytosine(1402)-N(4))-methyltransferase RsmH [Microbacteriaceae bacterium]|nr:16S rRNA (cytosine(1402)-N(4))-methyltransferase RsmH [Microbacteriaceae bacterium]
MTSTPLHIPVLLERSVELLAPALESEGALLVDATVGMGGHAKEILARLPNVRLIGIDRDEEALEVASRTLAPYQARVTLRHAVYDEIGEVLDDAGESAAAAILFDLGVSSLQLDRTERGFAYAKDAPLDMRMDTGESRTAADILAEYPEERLSRIFRDYGEERLATRYARRIVAEREARPILTSARLVAIIEEATPAAVRRRGHPAKRVFQALRIAVNDELAALENALPQALARTALGGRVAVMSYQSLEDRIVKRDFAAATASRAPLGLPVEAPAYRPRFVNVFHGAEQADATEIESNPRAASVRLRVVERVRSEA